MRYFNSAEDFEIEYDYDAVILIGNGFDLNFGLKTGYCDFIKSKNFEDLIKEDNDFAKHLKSRHNLQNWIDIENELKTYSSLNGGLNETFFNEFKNLSSALMEYLGNINIKTNKKSASYKLIESIKNLSTLIIDFNYTSTLQNVLKELESEDITLHIDHLKIHGSLEKKNIIFGVEDKAKIYHSDVFLKKSVNINFQSIDFSESIQKCSHFIIFGHSLGETDYMYYDDFFKKACRQVPSYERKEIYIYFYGEENYYNLFRQIDNLTGKNITRFKQYNKLKMIDTK
jgi:hypothetical protein